MKLSAASILNIHRGKASMQYLATLAATFSMVASGMHYGWPSPSLPILLQDESAIKISKDEGSWLAVTPLIANILGGVIVGIMVDILGRKRMIMVSSLPYFAAWIMIAYSKSIWVLFAARFIAGVADGWVYTAVPMYIGELADAKIRGLLGCSVAVTWIFGILMINIIGCYLSIRITAIISSFLPIIAFVSMIWMPESSYYLLMKGNRRAALQSLETFRGVSDVDSDLNRINEALKNQMENTSKFVDLFTVPSNRRALFIMTILRTAQQLSGTSAITFNAQYIFKETGNNISSELTTIIYFFVQFILTMFSSSIVDWAGRKPLLNISIGGSAIALLIEGIYFWMKENTDLNMERFSIIPVISLIAFVVTFSLGLQTIPLLMLGELFPANVKAFALSFTGNYFCVLVTVVAKFFQIMNDSFGIYAPFFAFAFCCGIGLVALSVVPETKGKTLEDIQVYLKGTSANENTSTIKNNFSCIHEECII